METVPGTRRGLEVVDRRYWQARLFGHIATAPDFGTIMRSLLPQWERARRELAALASYGLESPEDVNEWEYYDVVVASLRYPDTYGRELPNTSEYSTALDTALCRDLRLVWRGQPAAWAREHLHHAVNPRSLLARPAEGVAMPKDWRTVRIELSAAGGYVLRGNGQNTFVLPDPDQLVFAETDWKRMREAAERAAGDAVDELRAWFEATYQRIGYGVAWEGWKRDCERLALWLMGRVEPSDRADRESLRRMAERIRVHPPGKRNRTNPAT